MRVAHPLHTLQRVGYRATPDRFPSFTHHCHLDRSGETMPGAPFMTALSSWVGFSAAMRVAHPTNAGGPSFAPFAKGGVSGNARPLSFIHTSLSSRPKWRDPAGCPIHDSPIVMGGVLQLRSTSTHRPISPPIRRTAATQVGHHQNWCHPSFVIPAGNLRFLLPTHLFFQPTTTR